MSTSELEKTKRITLIGLVVICLSLITTIVFLLFDVHNNKLATTGVVISLIIGFIMFFKGSFKSLIITKKDIRWSIAIILLIIAWMGITPTLYEAVLNGKIAIWFEKIYKLLNNNNLLNLFVCTSLVLLLYYLIKTDLKITRLFLPSRLYRLFLILFFYVALFYKSPFKYAIIISGIDYRLFLSIELFIILLAILINWIHGIDVIKEAIRIKYNHYNNGQCSIKGFSTDKDSNLNPQEDIIMYANSIVKKLLETKLAEESFAVGITGEWGSGKTTFLNILKQEVKHQAKQNYEDVVIVEFNPWMCRTPEQVTRDFFSSLRHQLSINHIELSKPVQEYANYLSAVSLRFPGLSLKLSGFLSEKSLYERKMELSKMFSMLDIKIVVVIDDIDRLESSEVFEVLRLIRNTADLSNMIYLVAFDKNYVTSLLKEKSVDNPIAYLEKIFQVEFQLPMITNGQILELLNKEINQQLDSVEAIKKIETDYLIDEKELILQVITNYRKAKRFARLFSLNYSHLFNTSFNLVSWKDVFWLNLLQMSDKSTYDQILCNEPWTILKKTNDDKIYVFENNINDQKRFKNKPVTQKILLKLFEERDSNLIEQNSVCFTEHYERYFTMKVLFSKKDLDNLLNSEDVDRVVKDWESQKKPFDGFFKTLGDSFESYDEEKKKKIIEGCFAVLYYYFYYNTKLIKQVVDMVKRITDGSPMDDSSINPLCLEKIIIWFTTKLNSQCKLSIMSRILNDLYEYYSDDIEGKVYAMIEQLLNAFLRDNKNSTVLDVINGNYELYDLIVHLPKKFHHFAVNRLIELYSEGNRRITEIVYSIVMPNNSVLNLTPGYRDHFLNKIRSECMK